MIRFTKDAQTVQPSWIKYTLTSRKSDSQTILVDVVFRLHFYLFFIKTIEKWRAYTLFLLFNHNKGHHAQLVAKVPFYIRNPWYLFPLYVTLQPMPDENASATLRVASLINYNTTFHKIITEIVTTWVIEKKQTLALSTVTQVFSSPVRFGCVRFSLPALKVLTTHGITQYVPQSYLQNKQQKLHISCNVIHARHWLFLLRNTFLYFVINT